MLRKILPAFFFPKEKPAPRPEPQKVIAFTRKYGYNTSFGHVIVTWSRPSFSEPSICTVVGFAVPDTERASTSSMPVDSTQEVLFQPFSFEVNPTQPHQMRGFKQFVVMKPDSTMEPLCSACFAWDFSRARCHIPDSVEPSSCYYFAVVIDDEMLILYGDMPEWAYGLTKARLRSGPTAVLTRREDRVKMKGFTYNTSVTFGGVEHEISINLTRGMLALMFVEIDGRQVVAVKNLFKKFRGTDKFDLSDGHLIQITWDLHDWIFGHAVSDGSDSSEEEEAAMQEKEDGIFTFSFIEQRVNTACKTCPGKYVDVMRAGHGLSWWRLLEEWVSSEEERMYKGETFCFMVYLWKS
jgi:Plant protein of unknown function (DUF868)